MKTATFLALLLLPLQALCLTVELPDLIEVTSGSSASHGMSVSFALTTDDYGEPVDSADRVVSVRVPRRKGERPLTSMSLLLTPPNKHLSVPLAFREEKDSVVATFSADVSILKAATVFADYSKDEKDLGASHLIRLGSFIKEDQQHQNKAIDSDKK